MALSLSCRPATCSRLIFIERERVCTAAPSRQANVLSNIMGCGSGQLPDQAVKVSCAKPPAAAMDMTAHALEKKMPEVIFNGSDGRLEGRYVHGEGPTPPLAHGAASAPAARRDDEQPDRLQLVPHVRPAGLLGAAVQFPWRRPFAGRVRPRAGRAARHGGGAGLDAGPQPEQHGLLGRRLLVRRLDRHAAADAAARDRGLHVREPAGQHVRFHLPRPLPVPRA